MNPYTHRKKRLRRAERRRWWKEASPVREALVLLRKSNPDTHFKVLVADGVWSIFEYTRLPGVLHNMPINVSIEV